MEESSAIFAIIGGLIYLAIIVLSIAGMWKVFSKAGEPGWACIIPIYNLIVFLKIAGRPLWWLVLMLIPFVGFVIFVIICLDLAKRFGKSGGFGIGLLLLPFIFYPMLGFGDAEYSAPDEV